MSRRILVISPTPSHPQNAGNRARIYNLLLNLRAAGHVVYFAYVEETPGDKTSMLQCWGDEFFSAIAYNKPETARKKAPKHFVAKILIWLRALFGSDPRYTYAIDDWYDDLVDGAIDEISKSFKPDVVIAEYVFFSKALENFDSSVLKIIDTHDVFTNRYKLYLNNKQCPRWFSTTEKEEQKGLNRANSVIAIQGHEEQVFSTLLEPPKKVVTVGHLVPLQSLPVKIFTYSILYIGSCNPINVEGVDSFIRDVFPKIKNTFKDAKLILAGDICDVVDDFEGCLKLGRVEALEEAYALSDVIINPVHFGTGLKIKSIEALGYAKPLVTTPIGAEGLETGTNEAFLLANTADEFAHSIIQIFSDGQIREKLSRNAYSFAQRWNQRCLEALINLLNSP